MIFFSVDILRTYVEHHSNPGRKQTQTGLPFNHNGSKGSGDISASLVVARGKGRFHFYFWPMHIISQLGTSWVGNAILGSV